MCVDLPPVPPLNHKCSMENTFLMLVCIYKLLNDILSWQMSRQNRLLKKRLTFKIKIQLRVFINGHCSLHVVLEVSTFELK